MLIDESGVFESRGLDDHDADKAENGIKTKHNYSNTLRMRIRNGTTQKQQLFMRETLSTFATVPPKYIGGSQPKCEERLGPQLRALCVSTVTRVFSSMG